MIVDCGIYREGHRVSGPEDFPHALEAIRSRKGMFLWLGLHEPTAHEFDLIFSELKLHPLAVEDAVKAHQRPKLEQYENSLFIVLKTLRFVESSADIETGEIMLFVGDGFVVSVRHGEANPLAGVRARLEEHAEVLRHGPSAVLYAVCDSVVDVYTAIAAEVEGALDDLEAQAFAPNPPGNQVEAIYTLKREVLEFRRAVGPLIPVLDSLVQGRAPFVHEHARPFFRDVEDHAIRVHEQVESFDRLLSDILSANLAQVGVRQNNDMRRISAWAAMITVPTMIAGIYGMNFDHMPELHWRYGYPAVLMIMVLTCLTLHRLFKRNGWL